MPTNLSWFVENRMLRLNIIGSIEVDTMLTAMQEVSAKLDASNAVLLHLIIDVRHGENNVMNLKARVEAVRPVLEHPKCGWVVLVGQTNPVANFLSSTTAQVFKARFRSYKSAEDGIAFLRSVISDFEIPELDYESSG